MRVQCSFLKAVGSVAHFYSSQVNFVSHFSRFENRLLCSLGAALQMTAQLLRCSYCVRACLLQSRVGLMCLSWCSDPSVALTLVYCRRTEVTLENSWTCLERNEHANLCGLGETMCFVHYQWKQVCLLSPSCWYWVAEEDPACKINGALAQYF